MASPPPSHNAVTSLREVPQNEPPRNEQLETPLEHNFDYGGSLGVSDDERLRAQSRYSDKEIEQAVSQGKWKDFEEPATRKYPTKDEELVTTSTSVQEYWNAIIRFHTPRPQFDLRKVVHELSTIQAHVCPSSTPLYKATRAKLAAILQYRRTNKRSWPFPDFNLPAEEVLESLRIYGDAEKGLGVLPAEIASLLEATGLVFLTLPKPYGSIPQYWENYFLDSTVRGSIFDGEPGTEDQGLLSMSGRIFVDGHATGSGDDDKPAATDIAQAHAAEPVKPNHLEYLGQQKANQEALPDHFSQLMDDSVQAFGNEVRGLGGETVKQNGSLYSLGRHITNFDQQIKALEDEKSKKKATLDTLGQEIEALDNEKSRKRNLLEALGQEVKALEDEKSRKKAKLDTLGQEIEALSEEKTRQEGLLSSSRNDAPTFADIARRIQDLEQNSATVAYVLRVKEELEEGMDRLEADMWDMQPITAETDAYVSGPDTDVDMDRDANVLSPD
ncbi:hypothetical protein F5Y13DRAFT_162492 [Hypoxylon sp. FL1857]|nr:hypothetical protein F5Y13DRAFT_162492 [Hypoxylon sp. FL1857]